MSSRLRRDVRGAPDTGPRIETRYLAVRSARSRQDDTGLLIGRRTSVLRRIVVSSFFNRLVAVVWRRYAEEGGLGEVDDDLGSGGRGGNFQHKSHTTSHDIDGTRSKSSRRGGKRGRMGKDGGGGWKGRSASAKYERTPQSRRAGGVVGPRSIRFETRRVIRSMVSDSFDSKSTRNDVDTCLLFTV